VSINYAKLNELDSVDNDRFTLL